MVWFSATPGSEVDSQMIREAGVERREERRGFVGEERWGRGLRTVGFLVLLVLPHGHESGSSGEDFVAETSLVIGLLGISLVIVALLLGLLGIV